MKKRISIPICILMCIFFAFVSFQITHTYDMQKSNNNIAASNYINDKLSYVDSIYRNYYIGDIDEEKLTDSLIDGYVYGAGDKYGQYLTKDEASEYLDYMEGTFVGIGVNVIYDTQNNLIQIINIIEDSPAQESGLLEGDYIYKIEDEYVSDLGYYGTIAKVKGEEGTKVNLTILRNNETNELNFSIERKRLTEQTVYSHFYEGTKIGVIRISSFAEATPTQFKKELDNLLKNNAKALIFDLRNNPGGELNSITSILDVLLPEGDIIITEDKDGNKEVIATSDSNEINLPMAVLTNENTASAAELFTASIRDYNKGIIVGSTTYGKGTMLTILRLPDGSALSISYMYFTSKAGINYEGVGIKPDYEVELDENAKSKNIYTLTDKEDNVLTFACEYLNK